MAMGNFTIKSPDEHEGQRERRMESHFRKETPWTSMMKAKDFGPTSRQQLDMERAASGDDVSPSHHQQQQLQQIAKPPASGGSVNPMEDMQSWLKANIPQAQVFVNVNYSIKNSSVRFEPAAAGNSASQHSHDSTQLAASAALDNNPPPPAQPNQGPLHSILSSKKIPSSSREGSNANNNNSNKKKRVLIHARKDSPFEVWVPPTALKRQKVKEEQPITAASQLPSSSQQLPKVSIARDSGRERSSNMNMYHQSVAINSLNHSGRGPDMSGMRQTYRTLSMMQQEIMSCPAGSSTQPLENNTNTSSLSETISSVISHRSFRGMQTSAHHQSPIMPRAQSIQTANHIQMQNYAKYLMPQGIQARPLLSKQQMDSKLTEEVVKRCSCKRTKCLKLYCPCFADGLFCNAKCNCSDCFNDQNCIAQVQEGRKAIQSKNPDAFKPKVRMSRATKAYSSTPHTQGGRGGDHSNDNNVSAPATLQHQRGCRCTRTRCLKRYCECFAAGAWCGPKCSCSNCLNNEESAMMMTKGSTFMNTV